MPSFLSIAQGVSGALTSLNAFLLGGGGVLTLDDLEFDGFAAPEKLTDTATQRVVKHVTPGGDVTLSLMGVEYDPIEWEGVFEGADAQDRASNLRAKRDLGEIVTLAWNDQSLQVVIERVSITSELIGWIRFSIRVIVQSISDDPKASNPTDDIGSGIGDALQGVSDTLGAIGTTATAVIQTGQTVINKVQSVAGAFGISIPALTRISSGLANAQGIASGVNTLASGTAAAANLASNFGQVETNIGKAFSAARTAITGAAGTALNIVNSASDGAAGLAGAARAQAGLGAAQGALSAATGTQPPAS